MRAIKPMDKQKIQVMLLENTVYVKFADIEKAIHLKTQKEAIKCYLDLSAKFRQEFKITQWPKRGD